MTKPRPNVPLYRIDRIEYLPPADQLDWVCVLIWLSLTIGVLAVWIGAVCYG